MTVIEILGICAMVLTLVATCYVFSDSFLDSKSKSKNVRYYGYGNWKSKKKSL